MKKYITIAALLTAGAAFANAEEISITINPFRDQNNVTSGYDMGTWGTLEGTADFANGTWYGVNNWAVTTATYTLTTGINLTHKADTLSFQYTLHATSDGNNILTMSLVGDNRAIITGKGLYNYAQGVQIGTSDNSDASGYAFSGTNDTSVATGVYTISENITGGIPKSSETTLSGKIAWNEEKEQFVLTYTSASASATPESVTLDLGKSVDVNKVVFTADGTVAGTAEKGGFSAVSLTASIVPEPSAFGLLAGLGSLALVASRRRRK